MNKIVYFRILFGVDIVMVIFDLFIVNVVAGIGFVMVIVKVLLIYEP